MAAILVLVIAGGGDDEDSASTTTSQTETATTETAPTDATETTETTQTTTKPAGPPTYRVTIQGGKPVGGVKDIEVDKGDTVNLVVKSDVPDEIHIHGYDLTQDVEAGGSARFKFKATSDGKYEIELENRGEQIAELTVQP